MRQKYKLSQVINETNKIIGQSTLQELFSYFMEKRLPAVYSDQTHPLYFCFEVLPSGQRLHCLAKRTFTKDNLFHWVTVLNQILN